MTPDTPAPAAPAGTNPTRKVRVLKIVVNAGVGGPGDPRAKAVKVLEMVSHQKPVSTKAKSTNRDWGLRLGQEIGAKVTLRGTKAIDFLNRALDARDRQLEPESIDRDGNISFGIPDYTDFAGMKYDPTIGIYGFDVAVEIGRAGWRVRSRKVRPHRVPRAARVRPEETRKFLETEFQAKFLE